MHQVLTTYIIFQSLLFSITTGQKPENRSLAFYFTYLLLFHVFFVLSEGLLFDKPSESVRISYEFIALCNSAVVFSLIYSILRKPMPWPLYLLWLVPVLHILADYIFKNFNPEFYNAGFYENWYLSFPFYIKMLFTGLLIWQIRVFKKEIRKNSASKDQQQHIKLYWGKCFIYFHVTLSSLLVLYLFLTLTNGRLYTIHLPQFTYSPHYYNLINRGGTALFMLILGYLALRNPTALNITPPDFQLEPKIMESVLTGKEKNTPKMNELSDEQLRQYARVINKLMEAKVYLDPELSLHKLSKLSHIPSRHLSQYIKAAANKNYKEYINSYRIAHARELLTQSNASNDTIYSIAFESGFSSESTFYQVFKQQTSLTPKLYQHKFKNRM